VWVISEEAKKFAACIPARPYYPNLHADTIMGDA
jgi:hypothetical protein